MFQSLSKGFANNLGYFAIVILSAFFIAGWISTQGSASFGKFGISLSPLLGAGMVCPDTAYASLAPIAGQHRKYIAIGCYSGFKLLMPAGPLIIGIGLGANTHDPKFLYLGVAADSRHLGCRDGLDVLDDPHRLFITQRFD